MLGRVFGKFPWPYPHFMAFAPLDAWWRMLNRPRARVPAAYWPRLVFGLFTSVLGTALTLPERLLMGPVLWAGGRRGGARLRHRPGVVLILGYYRSGTTHLHYLLSCDPRFRTPRWCETLAPQGFLLSWAFLRVFMIPFVSATRPQDDVAIGPEWPAEDDFAVNNWTVCSALPGRFVLPRMHGFYDRFHALEGLNDEERRRWRWTQWAFCRKLAWLARRRAILLKTPSHTARVAELLDLFGAEHVKLIHISREPSAVVRSNVTMASRLSVYNLQPPGDEDDVRGRITREYIRTEELYLRDVAAAGPGRVVEVRYEDLVADPIGELRRIYSELGWAWSGEFEKRVGAYLAGVRDYRAATPAGQKAAVGGEDPEHAADLKRLAERFGHDRPPRPPLPKMEALPGEGTDLRPRVWRSIAAGLFASWVCVVLWISQAYVLKDRHDFLAWPVGIIIGYWMIREARAGSRLLGWVAAGLTLAVFMLAVVPSTFLMDYAHRPHYEGLPMKDWEWDHILKASRRGFVSWNNFFWGFMGCVTAYRYASRTHVHPPGSG